MIGHLRHPLRLRDPLAGCALASLTLLTGCATFGSNVRGSFSCAAPDGICAPSSSIDDRALAMIAADGSASDMTPAGAVLAPRAQARRSMTAATRRIQPVQPGDARRTQERVLRIVFQPYIDDRGRLHEMSAVHAVVQSGQWQQQTIASATVIPDRHAALLGAVPGSLAEAVERADAALVDASEVDPNLPDPAVVAAARARSVDPVASIKTDVAARLAPKTSRSARTVAPPAPASSRTPGVPLPAAPNGAKPASPGAASATSMTSSAGTVGVAELPRTTVGVEATARVKASPSYRGRGAEAQDAERTAAGVGALSGAGSDAKPVVRAAGFPATVPQEN